MQNRILSSLNNRIYFTQNKLFLLNVILILLLTGTSTYSLASNPKAKIGGSFISGSSSWSDARWQEEFKAMKDAGMQYVIVGTVASSYPGKVTTTIYPSNIPNTEMETGEDATSPDVVDACLRNAQIAGMKVFIGADMSEHWWSSYANDSTWLYGQMKLDNQICDELWNNYKKKYPDTFIGWYWCYEIDNQNFMREDQQEVLINAMNKQLDHLDAKNERMPMMWCPFMNSNLGTPDECKTMWEKLFAGLHLKEGDIFCPQDCIGAGGLEIYEVASWFAALKEAVDTKPGLLMWSDVETFDSKDWSSATIGRVVKQLELEQPYVDNFVTWQYCFYDSPLNVDPGYHKTYMGYFKEGALETIPPTVPGNFTAVLQDGENVVLNWSESTDNIGVCGYYVYRNGEMIFRNQIPRKEAKQDNKIVLATLTDMCLPSNGKYTYEVRAYDFADNVSDPTPAITINIDKINYLPNLVSAGCSYSVSIPSYTDTLDPKDKKLTDGIYANSVTVNDSLWEGFHTIHQKPRDVIIDLGKTIPVQQFLASYLLDTHALVYLPYNITVLVSTDGVNFENVGDFPNPHIPYDARAISYKYRLTLSKPVLARYVNFRTSPTVRWYDQLTFSDEFEVRSK